MGFGFTGRKSDAYINLTEMGARWYDPVIGRWISPDSIVPQPGNPQALNRFSYCVGNPLKYTDPTGHAYEWGYNPDEAGGGEFDPYNPPIPQPSGPNDLDTYAKMPYEDHSIRTAYRDFCVGNEILGTEDANSGIDPFRMAHEYGAMSPLEAKMMALRAYAQAMNVDPVEAEKRLRLMARQGQDNPYEVGAEPEALAVANRWHPYKLWTYLILQFPQMSLNNIHNYEPTYLEMVVEAHPHEFDVAVGYTFTNVLCEQYKPFIDPVEAFFNSLLGLTGGE